MAIGLAGVAAAAWRSHKTSSRLDFIRSLGSEAELYAEAAPTVERVQEPLVNRIFGPAARGVRNTLARLYPSSEVDRVHADLLKAGLTGTIRAEEFVAIQMGSALLGIALGLVLSRERRRRASRSAWRCSSSCRSSAAWRRAGGFVAGSRRDACRVTNDLPDLLDLMTISVAAGLGLEQAMQVSCARFESPVCDELRLTLREMELGLSRHDALDNLKLRTDIDDLITFSVVLSQADALGLPIGRVLEAQADEMRDKRRQRAREKAAKVPVKILFPLALCFLPAIMIIVLGPIVGPIKHAFHGA